MENLATTKMSSKGQIVIPESIRNQLGLTAGSQFVVVSDEKDVVILKRIKAPPLQTFSDLIKQARQQAKAAGLKPSDIKTVVKQARSKA